MEQKVIHVFNYFGLFISVVYGQMFFRQQNSEFRKNMENFGVSSLVPGYCSSFILSGKNYSEEFKCPLGLDYNTLYRNCDFPSSAECDMRCTENNEAKMFYEDCNIYIQCKNNLPGLSFCPTGTYYNRWMKSCVAGHSDECILKCPKGFGIFPVTGNIQRYMVCYNGYPYIYTCPKGLYFDVSSSTCGRIGIYKFSLPKCPRFDGIFGNEELCNSYTICTNNEAVVHFCPPGFQFDALRLMCDYPERTTCASNPKVKSQRDSQKYHLQFREQDFEFLPDCPESTIGRLMIKAGYTKEVNAVCPKSDGYFADETKCNSFIKCQNGNIIEKIPCLSGLHFNQAISMCDYRKNAHWTPKCSGRKLGIPGLCNGYLSCDEKLKLNFCSTGLHYNFEVEQCDLPANVLCEPLCSEKADYALVNGQCGMAYLCIKGKASDVIKCPPGLYFDVDTGNCDFPENIHCPWPWDDIASFEFSASSNDVFSKHLLLTYH